MPKLKQLLNSSCQLEDLINLSKSENFDFNERDENNISPLYWALDSEKDEIAFWMMEMGAIADSDCLYASAQRGCLNSFSKIIKADIKFDEPFSHGGFTPLLAAISEAPYFYKKDLKITKVVNGETVEVTDPDEIITIAGRDRFKDYLSIIRQLLEKGANPNYCEPKNKQNSAIFVGARGTEETAKLILKYNAQVNHQDSFGLTPLHWASRKGFLEIVKMYVAAGANINIQEGYGFTPLHEAAENGFVDIAEFLIESGADHKIGLLCDFDMYKVGDTAYDVAKKKKNKVANYLKKIKK